jgi:hypothetical protein
LYIRSQKTNSPTGEATTVAVRFAFDLTAALPEVISDNQALLYFKYKTGTKNGTDVYKSFEKYPVLWLKMPE